MAQPIPPVARAGTKAAAGIEVARDLQADVQKLRAGLRGSLLTPADREYEAARRLYNAAIDKRPQFIAQCADSDDVVKCVNFARDSGLQLAVRGGGHSAAGLCSVNHGFVIDLSTMRAVHVDTADRKVRVQGGCTWGEVDKATQPFGLAVPSGIISTTGVGGLTLGGGHGYLSRKYGLTIDNLLAAEVVLASGERVRASEGQARDLFWALRGGGGNFGVVTEFEFRAHPVERVIGGPIFWPLTHLEASMRWYRDWLARAPDDLSAFYVVTTVPSGPPFPESARGQRVCGVVCCFLGPQDKAEAALAEVRSVAPAIADMAGWIPYVALQTMHDALYPKGLNWYWKGELFRDLPDDSIAVHRQFAQQLPTPLCGMHLYPIDGAVRRMRREDTAWSNRDALLSMVIVGVDEGPAHVRECTQWVRNYWNALQPFSTAGGAYVNFLMEEGQDRVAVTYADNWPRLRRVKTMYDPQNLFCVNQNVKPHS